MTKLGLMVRLAVVLSLGSGAIAFSSLPGSAQEAGNGEREVENEGEPFVAVPPSPLSTPSSLSELEQPATTVEDWIAQIEASLVQITNVRLEETESGLQVILETAEGELAVSETRTVGNALIADIPNAAIAEEFSQADPIEGIALVSVTSLPGDRVRVAITGTDAPPVAEVTATGLAVTLGEAVAGTDDDAIQVVVTGEQDEGYNPSNATTATRTDTPLRDIPASITVVPRQVLEDRNVRRFNEALETVPGVSGSFSRSGSTTGNTVGGRYIRGFINFGTFRNGLPQNAEFDSLVPIGTIERVEVLRGPASVLFGQGDPGGIVNTVTRQPLSEPYYRVEFEAGNRNFFQPVIDLSGPLTADDTVLYRLIAGYETQDGFKEFTGSEQFSIAPSITINFSERTNLNLYYEYSRNNLDTGFNFPDVIRPDGSFITPRNLFTSYLNTENASSQTERYGYTFNHSFSDNWQIRNSLVIEFDNYDRNGTFFGGIRDERFLTFSNGFSQNSSTFEDNYFGNIELLGRFNTGSISHQVLVGFDVNDFGFDDDRVLADASLLPDLDIFNPNYDVPDTPFTNFGNFTIRSRAYGLYLQDQIAFSDNLRLLIGGRFDWVSADSEGVGASFSSANSLNDSAFSPRLGLVYQPSDIVALYASYTRSFRPSTFDIAPDGSDFEPTRGTQYEVGVKADFLDGRLSTTLAAYHLTRTNVITPDPDPVRAAQGFSIQTGEQRSQGIELDVAGEILPGWNVILAYAYTDAEVTEDNVTPVGNRLDNAPEHQASLWTTYEIQSGDLQGLGFGLGLFYVGERRADLANEVTLRDYFRTDASLFYRRGGFRGAINVRNLFDIDYVEQAFGRFDVQRGTPFTIVGSLSWEF